VSVEIAIRTFESLKREGRFVDALQTLADAVRRRFFGDGGTTERPATPLPIDAIAIEKLADLASLLGRFEGADNLLLSLATWYKRAGNLYFSDYVSVKRIHLALGRGLGKDVRSILKTMESTIGDIESIEVSEAGLKRWEGQIGWAKTTATDRQFLLACFYLEMGRVLSGLGQYKDSLAMLIRGLMNAERCPQYLAGNLALHLKLATVAALLEMGELAAARNELNDLQPQLSAMQQPGLFARSLELAGKLDLLSGNFGRAREKLWEVLNFCLSHSFDLAAVAASLNLGHVLIYLNQTNAAQQILSVAKKSAERLNDKANEMRAYFLLRMVQARSTSLADEVSIASPIVAMWGWEETATIRQSSDEEDGRSALGLSDNFLAFFEDRALSFQLRLANLDLSGASGFLSDINEVFKYSDSTLIRLRLKMLAGMLAYYKHDFSASASIFEGVRPFLVELGLKPELWQAQRFLSWSWNKLGRPEQQQEALAKETQRLLAEMTESLPADEQAIFLLNKWTADEEYIVLEINRLIKLKAELARSSWSERLKLRVQLWRQLHELLEHIDLYKDAIARRLIEKRDARIKKAPVRPLWKRLFKHSRARATLSLLVLPDRVFIVRSGWMELDFGVSPVTRIQVREIVREWHELILEFLEEPRNRAASPEKKQADGRFAEEKTDEVQSRLKAVSEQLAKALQIPQFLDGMPKRVRALTIVPDDSLHGFPFAAIVHEGKYLIERFALSVAFESSSSEMRSPSSKRDYALIVGVSQGAGDLPPLKGTVKELQQVSVWLAEHKVKELRLDDFEKQSVPADAAKVLRLLANARLFHIVCHGEFKSHAPDESGLVLVPERERTESLTLKDLSELNLSGLKHTTLSSCWSADNFVLPGRWVISLPETMWRAGCQSVLGCLWLVSDDVAVSLMKKFYYYADKHPRDQALRRAQLDCLNDNLSDCDIENKDNPFFWAGYTLYGDHTRLKL
jgi:CHAT domain-containing protein